MSAVRPPMRGRASWQASASGQSSRPIASRGSPDSACGSSACARSGCADPLARRSTECIGHPSCSSHPTCPRSGEEAASATDAWAAAAARTRPRPVSAATRADGEAGWGWRAMRDWEELPRAARAGTHPPHGLPKNDCFALRFHQPLFFSLTWPDRAGCTAHRRPPAARRRSAPTAPSRRARAAFLSISG